jgi:hypothetical protein
MRSKICRSKKINPATGTNSKDITLEIQNGLICSRLNTLFKENSTESNMRVLDHNMKKIASHAKSPLPRFMRPTSCITGLLIKGISWLIYEPTCGKISPSEPTKRPKGDKKIEKGDN